MDEIFEEIEKAYNEHISPDIVIEKIVERYGEKYRPLITEQIKNTKMYLYSRNPSKFCLTKMVKSFFSFIKSSYGITIDPENTDLLFDILSSNRNEIVTILDKCKKAKSKEELLTTLNDRDIRLFQAVFSEMGLSIDAKDFLIKFSGNINKKTSKTIEQLTGVVDKKLGKLYSSCEEFLTESFSKFSLTKKLAFVDTGSLPFKNITEGKSAFLMNMPDMLKGLITKDDIVKNYLKDNPDIIKSFANYIGNCYNGEVVDFEESELFKIFDYERFYNYCKQNNILIVKKEEFDAIFETGNPEEIKNGLSTLKKNNEKVKKDKEVEQTLSSTLYLQSKEQEIVFRYTIKEIGNTSTTKIHLSKETSKELEGKIVNSFQNNPSSMAYHNGIDRIIAINTDVFIQRDAVIHEYIHAAGCQDTLSGFNRLQYINSSKDKIETIAIDEIATEYMASEVDKMLKDEEDSPFIQSETVCKYTYTIDLIRPFLDCYHDEIIDFKLRKVDTKCLDKDYTPQKGDEYALPEVFKNEQFIKMCRLLQEYDWGQVRTERKEELEKEIKEIVNQLVELKKEKKSKKNQATEAETIDEEELII